MNDTELDRLLDTWRAPEAPRSLRDGVRARFSDARPARRGHPLRWMLAVAAASMAAALAMEQTGTNPWDFRIMDVLNHVYEHLSDAIEAHRALFLAGRIRSSEPRLFVDGQRVPGPEEFRGGNIEIDVPGAGPYTVTTHHGAYNGWVEAGRVHGKTLEFQAGGKRVRIECNSPIADSDLPVYVRPRRN